MNALFLPTEHGEHCEHCAGLPRIQESAPDCTRKRC